jgi:hypothetical protein
MSITYYNPDRPQQRQYEFIMQSLMNLAMQRTQLNFRKDEAETARTHVETMAAVQGMMEGSLREPKPGGQRDVSMAGVKPTTTTGKVRVQTAGEKPDVTLAGRGYKTTAGGPIDIPKEAQPYVGAFRLPGGKVQVYTKPTTTAAKMLLNVGIIKSGDNLYQAKITDKGLDFGQMTQITSGGVKLVEKTDKEGRVTVNALSKKDGSIVWTKDLGVVGKPGGTAGATALRNLDVVAQSVGVDPVKLRNGKLTKLEAEKIVQKMRTESIVSLLLGLTGSSGTGVSEGEDVLTPEEKAELERLKALRK